MGWRSTHAYTLGQTVFLPTQPPFWVSTKTYYDRMAPKIHDGALLFIGDSFFQGLAISTVDFAGINLGIGGDTIRGVINRTIGYEPLSRAGGTILQVGLNDFGAEGANWVYNIPVLFDKILAHFTGGPVVMGLIAPITQAAQSGYMTQANINTANGWLISKAEAYENVVLVDSPTILKDSNGYLAAANTIDGLHLNSRGQTIYIELLQTAIVEKIGN